MSLENLASKVAESAVSLSTTQLSDSNSLTNLVSSWFGAAKEEPKDLDLQNLSHNPSFDDPEVL